MSATPSPPTRARQKKSFSTVSMMVMMAPLMTVFVSRSRAGLVATNHVAMQVMAVVVMMVVHRQGIRHRAPEGFNKSRIMRDIRRISAAAYMLVQADNLIGCGHDQMQIMGCLLYTSPSPRDGLLSRM